MAYYQQRTLIDILSSWALTPAEAHIEDVLWKGTPRASSSTAVLAEGLAPLGAPRGEGLRPGTPDLLLVRLFGVGVGLA